MLQVQGRPGRSAIARPEGAARRAGLHKRVPIFRAWRRSTKARKTGETARVGVGPCHALPGARGGAGPLVDWKGDRTCGLRHYDDDEVGCGQDQHGRPHPRRGDETRFCAGHRRERPKRCTAQLSNACISRVSNTIKLRNLAASEPLPSKDFNGQNSRSTSRAVKDGYGSSRPFFPRSVSSIVAERFARFRGCKYFRTISQIKDRHSRYQ